MSKYMFSGYKCFLVISSYFLLCSFFKKINVKTESNIHSGEYKRSADQASLHGEIFPVLVITILIKDEEHLSFC